MPLTVVPGPPKGLKKGAERVKSHGVCGRCNRKATLKYRVANPEKTRWVHADRDITGHAPVID